MRRLALAFGIALLTVPFAACGDDDDDGNGTFDAAVTRDAPLGGTDAASGVDGGTRDAGAATDGGTRDGA